MFKFIALLFRAQPPKDGRDWLDLKKILLPIDFKRELAWYDGGL